MAVRDKVSSLRSAFLTGAGLAVALIGLAMFTHESGAHASCVALAQGLARGVHSGLDCGFTDTVYWAGIVVLVTGILSSVAVAASGISTATRARAVNAHLSDRNKGFKALGQAIDPTDPTTRWQLDPATDWRPGPAGWQAGPNAAVPFVPPRHAESVSGASFTQSNTLASPPPPAWYADPERQDAIRWWDGRSWGESRINPL